MKKEKILLGAGCFWGVEHILKKIPGIIHTEVGYAGGITEKPNYQEVCTDKTNHAEVVLVEYDSEEISFVKVLDVFFRLHDPTTLNRQHNDVGTQYRSVIFTYSDEQQKIAQDAVAKIPNAVTEVKKAPEFFKAEEHHQDYLTKNPTGYMCHILRDA